jgi:hypothetical protein
VFAKVGEEEEEVEDKVQATDETFFLVISIVVTWQAEQEVEVEQGIYAKTLSPCSPEKR